MTCEQAFRLLEDLLLTCSPYDQRTGWPSPKKWRSSLRARFSIWRALGQRMHTSITKLIDNGIVGYSRKVLRIRPEESESGESILGD
jgi:hypothetical protein